MSRIQAFAVDDIPQVVDLHKRVFPGNSFSTPELCAYFHRLFFENPWYDPDLPSLVYREEGGMILGFYGVVPRQMQMRGRPIRAAVSSQFMVDPSVRNRLAAVELQRTFFAGPQDLSFTDGANDASRKIWEGLGGLTAFPYSIHWTRILRPGRYFLDRAKQRRLSAAFHLALRPLGAFADFVATRADGSPFHQVEQPPEEDLTLKTLLEQIPRFSAARSLSPEYTEQSLPWLLEEAQQKRCNGPLRKVLVRGPKNQISGWYMCYINQRGISQVLQLVATKDSIRQVLDQLFYHAWRAGSSAVCGRLDPQFLSGFSEKRCLLNFDGPRLLMHSRCSNLRETIQGGNAFLTRLEGEWWMRFQGG